MEVFSGFNFVGFKSILSNSESEVSTNPSPQYSSLKKTEGTFSFFPQFFISILFWQYINP
jgi:hypothetical protein